MYIFRKTSSFERAFGQQKSRQSNEDELDFPDRIEIILDENEVIERENVDQEDLGVSFSISSSRSHSPGRMSIQQ